MEPKDNITQISGVRGTSDGGDENSSFAQRIRYFRTLMQMTQPELAESLGLTKNSISNWEAGRRRPEIDMLPALCSVLEITMDEFFGLQSYITKEDKNLINRFHQLTPSNQTLASRMVDTMLDMQREEWCKQVLANNRRIFFNDSLASAGPNNSLGDWPSGHHVYLHIDDDVQRADEIIGVTGDSMEPTFHDGDALLIEHTQEIASGEIGIFVVNGEGFVKEYQPDGLHSHNPQYPTMRFTENDDFRCVGRVIRALARDEFATQDELRVIEESKRR